jgi:tRNA-guanine family transglycosylase
MEYASMKKKRKRKLWFLCAGASDGRLPKAKVEGLLISTGYDCKTATMIQKTKEMIKKAKPKHVKLDSGGFQIHSAEKKGIAMTFDPKMPLTITKKCFNLAPRHVVEKSIEMKADSMIALDYPIRKIKNPDEQEKEFRKKLKYNVPWAIETARLRKKLCPEIALFIPVQAYNLRQFEEFCKKIKGIDFDGFSLPVRNMSMIDIAMFLLKMHKMGIKKVHILGSSSLKIMSVCAYMSQRFFDWVSFDATSWRISAQYGVFLQPDDLSSKRLNKPWSYDPHYKCHCNSCEGKTLGKIAALGRKERMKILVTHNYLATQSLCNKFGNAHVDPRYLEKHLSESKRNDIKSILKCMSEIEEMCSINVRKNVKTNK